MKYAKTKRAAATTEIFNEDELRRVEEADNGVNKRD